LGLFIQGNSMQPFSIRHGKALLEQCIRVSMKDRLRARLWMTVQKYNARYWYQPDTSDNWTSQTDLIEQTEVKLKRLLGLLELKSRAADEAVGIEGYFMKVHDSQLMGRGLGNEGRLPDALRISAHRGGSGWLDSLFPFLSGASRVADYAAVSRVVRLS